MFKNYSHALVVHDNERLLIGLLEHSPSRELQFRHWQVKVCCDVISYFRTDSNQWTHFRTMTTMDHPLVVVNFTVNEIVYTLSSPRVYAIL